MSSIGFPLLLIPVAICNIIAFLMPDLALSGPIPLFSIPLMSKDVWTVTLNDLLVALAILLLQLEVMRAARPASKYFTDHFLSLLVFAGAAAEFVMLPKFGNATFFLITLVAMVDFFAGIALRARRPRRVAAPAPVPAPAPAPVPPAPRYEPTPVAPVVPPAVTVAPAAVPAATSVAEAVLADHSDTKSDVRIEPKLDTPTPPASPDVVTPTTPQSHPDLLPDVAEKSADKPSDDKPKA